MGQLHGRSGLQRCTGNERWGQSADCHVWLLCWSNVQHTHWIGCLNGIGRLVEEQQYV
ncbi:unnamed protein product [Linum tenue]|uniref:Uncharacterized protein n=1 Tax=Linum tenue TaxID=586396 RepID=A0AAV0KAI7_9ROSI|nr:unnamed protein product [Linum tenue]